MATLTTLTEISTRRKMYRRVASGLSPSHTEQLAESLPGIGIESGCHGVIEAKDLVTSGAETASVMEQLRSRLGVTDEQRAAAINTIGDILLSSTMSN